MAETKITPSCLEIKVCGKVVGIEQIQGREKPFYANTVVIPSEDNYNKPTRVYSSSEVSAGINKYIR